MRLLSRLIYRMSEYTEVWENFSGYEGDLGYFSDIVAANDYSSQKARLSMEVIKQAFVKIQQQERELSRLEKLCEKSEVIVSQIPVLHTCISHGCLVEAQANRPSSNCS
jgi:hypothetical protein